MIFRIEYLHCRIILNGFGRIFLEKPNERLVLALGEGAEIKFGAPLVEGAKVEGEIVEHFRGPKLIAFKMKRRKGYRKRKGHRQELTKVKITSIA